MRRRRLTTSTTGRGYSNRPPPGEAQFSPWQPMLASEASGRLSPACFDESVGSPTALPDSGAKYAQPGGSGGSAGGVKPALPEPPRRLRGDQEVEQGPGRRGGRPPA